MADTNIVEIATNTGLYSGNVVIEYNTDQKVVKPVIKVNEKATVEAINKAVEMAIMALKSSVIQLNYTDFTIPEPTKLAIGAENDREEGIYAENGEILSAKEGEVEHHST